MKSLKKIVLATFAATAMVPVTGMAQDGRNQGYLIDTNGTVVQSAYGLCWHDSEWTPNSTALPCDPAPKPMAAVMPAPVVAAAPPPLPLIAAPAPAKPFPTRISFSADALFAFDKSTLKPEGKVMLDDLARQLDGATYDRIVATGHTDRFGSNEYNQKLSERRAASVKDYLVAKGIASNRIAADGKGETQPETKSGECAGPRSARVITCLQPDRRVDVEMSGTTTTGAR